MHLGARLAHVVRLAARRHIGKYSVVGTLKVVLFVGGRALARIAPIAALVGARFGSRASGGRIVVVGLGRVRLVNGAWRLLIRVGGPSGQHKWPVAVAVRRCCAGALEGSALGKTGAHRSRANEYVPGRGLWALVVWLRRSVGGGETRESWLCLVSWSVGQLVSALLWLGSDRIGSVGFGLVG